MIFRKEKKKNISKNKNEPNQIKEPFFLCFLSTVVNAALCVMRTMPLHKYQSSELMENAQKNY
jgi:hypothetical protein